MAQVGGSALILDHRDASKTKNDASEMRGKSDASERRASKSILKQLKFNKEAF